jgi:hypothetical protein
MRGVAFLHRTVYVALLPGPTPVLKRIQQEPLISMMVMLMTVIIIKCDTDA